MKSIVSPYTLTVCLLFAEMRNRYGSIQVLNVIDYKFSLVFVES